MRAPKRSAWRGKGWSRSWQRGCGSARRARQRAWERRHPEPPKAGPLPVVVAVVAAQPVPQPLQPPAPATVRAALPPPIPPTVPPPPTAVTEPRQKVPAWAIVVVLLLLWAFGPSAKWRSKVVLAGDRAPGRRKRVSTELARDENAPPLSEAEELARVVSAEHERSRKLTWSEALRVSFGLDSLTCPCGGKRRLIAVITPAKVVKKILRHLGLPADVVLKETQPVWRVRGPPGQVFPEDVAETGQDLAVDEDFGIDFVDELPLDDVAA